MVALVAAAVIQLDHVVQTDIVGPSTLATPTWMQSMAKSLGLSNVERGTVHSQDVRNPWFGGYTGGVVARTRRIREDLGASGTGGQLMQDITSWDYIFGACIVFIVIMIIG
ncbi:hypothetical protein GQ53DRAFT_94433 [Thozetella sp. PMI_491]|nr:hypothetical protein GQ53DRAFT_94433 [Thozetella sp. PMI_491]